MKIKKEYLQEITNLYQEQNLSIADIAQKFNVCFASMRAFMKKKGIKIRTLKEAKMASSKTFIGLKTWRDKNGSWNKGLAKDDPRVVSNHKKIGQSLTRNGTFKGKNNPMYGKIARTHTGFRKDLGHFVRSTWEANFARILKIMNLDYEYEKHTFDLRTGETYTPDFYVPSKDKFYEIKGYLWNAKHETFSEDYPLERLTLVDENLYGRLLKRFANKLTIEDGNTLFTKDEILEKYKSYCKDNKPSVSKFCKQIGISPKTIIKIFGSMSALTNLVIR